MRIILLLLLFTTALTAQENFKSADKDQLIPLRTLLQLSEAKSQIKAVTRHASIKQLSSRFGIYQLTYSNKDEWLNEYERLSNDRRVARLQFDYNIQFRRTPNDSLYDRQLNLERMNFPSVWDSNTGGQTADGEPIVIAVLDSGFDENHPDLAASIWINQGEIPGDSIDNDNNGFIDDIHGWNFDQNLPSFPNDQHGTQVIGIMGAVGNNEIGISGTSWQSQMMLFKIGDIANIIAAYDYVIAQRQRWQDSNGQEGALIVATNASFGLEGRLCQDFPVWGEMYDLMGAAGILTAASTANRSWDVERSGDMPTSCTSDFIIGVTNLGEDDRLWRSAAWGSTSVDLAATGQGSYTTATSGRYGNFGSTSAAAPYVTGAIALLYSMPCEQLTSLIKEDPPTAARLMRQAILRSVQKKTSLENLVATEGLLDVAAARDYLLELCAASEVTELSISKIYPNPASNHFFLEFSSSDPGPYQLSFINTAGQIVRHIQLDEGTALPYSNTISTQGLPNGVYILKLSNQKDTVFEKVVIEAI